MNSAFQHGQAEAGWAAYHLYYHEDLDRPLSRFVSPIVKALWQDREIDRFFFVRSALGGPHLRLRIRICADHQKNAAAAVELAAAKFLAYCPSKVSWSEESILRHNSIVLAQDPYEYDHTIYQDNTFLLFPIRFEVERYGGSDLIGSSIEFFVLSSITALKFFDQRTGNPSLRRLPLIFRLLVRQAFGFAADLSELMDLLDYAPKAWPQMASLSSKGDKEFETRRENFRALLATEIATLSSNPSLETEAARRLLCDTAVLAAPARRHVIQSQIHMTANRLGLLNPEELYLCHLITRSLRDLEESAPAQWKNLGNLLSASGAAERLEDLIAPAMTDFFGSPASK